MVLISGFLSVAAYCVDREKAFSGLGSIYISAASHS